MERGRGARGAGGGDRTRVLGQEHPGTLNSVSNLAFIWNSQAHNNEAIELMKECSQLKSRDYVPIALIGRLHLECQQEDKPGICDWLLCSIRDNICL